MKPIRFGKTDTIILIRSLVAQQTKPYNLPQLMRDFKTEVGYPMPTFGHRTALDFLRSMPETLKVVFENRGCYIKLGPGQDSTYIGSAIYYSGLVPEGCAYIPSISRQSTDRQFLNWDETHRVFYVKRPKTKCKEKKEKREKKLKKALRLEHVKPPPTNTAEDKERRLREDWAKRGAAFRLKCLSIQGKPHREPIIDRCLSRITLRESDLPVINLPYYLEPGDDIECSVTEVYNPHKFFLHLKRFRADLTRLMSSMQYFYTEYSVRYAVKRFKFKPTHICVALCSLAPNQTEWYRAKIIEYGDKTSTVFLVDYGTTVKTRTCDLKFLDRVFGKLPVQAVRGKLATIKPRDGNRWTLDCRKRFYSLVFEEDLVASVVHVDPKEHCLSVVLSRGEIGELCIDKALIAEKFAVPVGNRVEQESISSVDYESGDGNEMLEPQDINRDRKLRVQLPNLD